MTSIERMVNEANTASRGTNSRMLPRHMSQMVPIVRAGNFVNGVVYQKDDVYNQNPATPSDKDKQARKHMENAVFWFVKSVHLSSLPYVVAAVAGFVVGPVIAGESATVGASLLTGYLSGAVAYYGWVKEPLPKTDNELTVVPRPKSGY